MREILVRVPEEDAQLITQLLQKLGAEVREPDPTKATDVNKANPLNVDDDPVSPTYLFGKWKDVDIDADKLRQTLWDRNNKFL